MSDEAGNRALVRICLVHFGAAKVAPTSVHGSDVMIESQQSTVVVANVYKNLSDQDFWESLVAGPAKTIMSALRNESDELPVLQVWSRRWTRANRYADAKDADAFSLLLRVPSDDLPKWLRKSGTGQNPIFTSAKIMADDATSVDMHRVIWTSKSIHEATASLLSIPDHAGLVHRYPNSYGVRVEAKRFATAWQELRGDEPVPSQIPVKIKFVLTGVPHGVNGPTLEKWSKSVNWPLRALKRFSDGKYLVGAEKDPPAYHMMLDRAQVLIAEHQNRNQRKPPSIILGKLQLPQHDAAATDRGVDELFLNDPWKKAAPPVPVTRTATKPAELTGVPPSEATTELMAKQSTRLATVESELLQIKSQIAADQQATQQRFTQMDSTINGMADQLKQSLEEALRQQSANLVHTFETLLKKSPRAEASGPNRSRSPVR